MIGRLPDEFCVRGGSRFVCEKVGNGVISARQGVTSASVRILNYDSTDDNSIDVASVNMKISKLRIVNFRSLADITVPMNPGITVIIGENNAGKSALVSALRLLLPRAGQRRVMNDYDFHLASNTEDPKKSAGIEMD